MNIFKDKVPDVQLDELQRMLDNVRQQLTKRRAALTRAAQVLVTTGSDDLPELEVLMIKAETIYRGRRARESIFEGMNLFADPAWDIMLDLFIAFSKGHRISVSSSVIASAVAPTTGLRWVSSLVERDLIRRVLDPDDRRRAFLEFTEKGLDLTARAIARS